MNVSYSRVFLLFKNFRQSDMYLIVSPCGFNFASVVSDDVELHYSFGYIFYEVFPRSCVHFSIFFFLFIDL